MASSELNERDGIVLTLSEEEAKALWILLGNLSKNTLFEKGLSDEQAEMINGIWHSMQ